MSRKVERKISESGEDLCPVCSECMHIYAVGECDHPVCMKCATRMRVLCDQIYCAICRADLPKVAFTRKFSKFDSLKLGKFKLHHKYNIFFENEAVKTCFFEIQENRCNQCASRRVFTSFRQLTDHMKRDHTLFPCDICVKHTKLFSNERKFYDRRRLAEHRRQGDTDDKSHKGHPLCEFCDERYLDNDELMRHLRKDHFYCHYCEGDGFTDSYYDQYDSLKEHFKKQHFLCEEGDCESARFTNAFRYDLDLKAHKAAFHMKNLKRGMAKAARTLDIDFNMAPRENAHLARGKKTGVITRKDFTEVATSEDTSDRAGAFGRGKDQKRDRRNDRLEDKNLALAINASLNSQSSVSVVDHSLLQKTRSSTKSQEMPSEEKKYSRRSEDFPTLSGGLANDSKNNPDDEPDGSYMQNNSMATKLARANKFDIQEGGMEYDDFPSLGGSKSGTKPQGSRNQSKQFSGWTMMDDDFPDLDSGGDVAPAGGGGAPLNTPVWKPTGKAKPAAAAQKKPAVISSSTWAASNKSTKSNKSERKVKVDTESLDEYPSLSSIGNSLVKGASTGSASDALKKYSASGVSSVSQTSNVTVIENKPASSPTFIQSTPASVSTADFPEFSKQKQVFKEEFPTLGSSKEVVPNNAPYSGSWSKKGKSQASEKNSTESTDGMFKMKKKNKTKNFNKPESTSEDSSEFVKSTYNQRICKNSELTLDSISASLLNSSTEKTSHSKDSNGSSEKKPSQSVRENSEPVSSSGVVLKKDNCKNLGPPKSDKKPSEVVDEKPKSVSSSRVVLKKDDFPSLGSPKSDSLNTSNSWGSKNKKLQQGKTAENSGSSVSAKQKKAKKKSAFKESVAAESVEGNRSNADDENFTEDSSGNLNRETTQQTKNPPEKKSKGKKKTPQVAETPVETNKENIEKSNASNGENASETFPSIYDEAVSENKALPDAINEICNPHAKPYEAPQEFSVVDEAQDFPPLPCSSKPPPPGFTSKAPPPGFHSKDATSTVGKKAAPPPGFNNGQDSRPKGSGPAIQGLSDIAAMLCNNNVSAISPATNEGVVVAEESTPGLLAPTVFEYVKPLGFEKRNSKLINDIVNGLQEEEEKFVEFKKLSADFRNGEVSAVDYYMKCSDIVGAKSFDGIFPELLVLLPDIEKQQQLLRAYNFMQPQEKDASGKSEVGWKNKCSKFAVCPFCQQVLFPAELSIHTDSHQSSFDFPALAPLQSGYTSILT